MLIRLLFLFPASFLSFAIGSVNLQQREDENSYTITIPVLLSGLFNDSETASEAMLRRNCLRQATEFTLNATILPGYTLDWRVIEESRLQNAMLDLVNLAFEVRAKNNTVLSPFIAGPAFLKCADMYRTLYALRKIMTYFNIGHFLTICEFSFQFLSYEPVMNYYIGVQALRSSLYKTIGVHWLKWKEIGFVSTITLNTYDFAVLFGSLSLTHGVDTVYFDVAASYLNLFKGLVQHGRSRIVVVWTWKRNGLYTSLAECAEIYCSSYKAGVRAPNYLLIITSLECSRERFQGIELSSYCPRKILWEQFKIAFFIGQMLTPDDFVNTVDSYTDEKRIAGLARRLESIFDWKAQERSLLENGCARVLGRYMLERLNDPILTTLIGLNSTEQRLLAIYGKGIKRLTANDRKLFVKNAFAAIDELDLVVPSKQDLAGLSIWWVRQGIAADDGSLKFRDIAKWNRRQGSDAYFYTVNSTEFLNLSQSFEKIADPVWATKSGKKPKDLSETIVIEAFAETISTVTLLSLSAVICVFQLLMLMIAFSSKMIKNDFDVRSNAIPLAGCLLLDISAIINALGTSFFMEKLCCLLPLLPVLGLNTVNGWLLMQSRSIYALMHENRYISRKARKPNLFSLQLYEQTRSVKLKARTRRISKETLVIAICTLLVLVIWLASDPINYRSEVEEPHFDPELDGYYALRIKWCSSPSLIYWIAFLLAISDILLAGGCFRFAILPHKFRFVRNAAKPEIRNIKMAHYNSLVMINFVAIVEAVLSSKAALIEWQFVAFNAGQLAFSLSTSLIVFSPIYSSTLFGVHGRGRQEEHRRGR